MRNSQVLVHKSTIRYIHFMANKLIWNKFRDKTTISKRSKVNAFKRDS